MSARPEAAQHPRWKSWAVIAVVSLYAPLLAAADWPTYRKDTRRSGRTSETLDVASLTEVWRHQALQPPRPAWPGPARWDAYVKRLRMGAMRDYDRAYQPIAVGDRLFYASSADDAVHMLDAGTGAHLGAFVTGGPLRIPPSYDGGRLYFGSDDGYAYCLRADDLSLVWKFSPTEGQPLVLNDGRLISFWPCRTGVLVAEGTALFGMSLLPWKESYQCAVDAETGQLLREAHYVKRQRGVTLEGAWSATATHVVAPQGRVAPYVFRRADGSGLGQLSAGGGSFVLITDDQRIVHGPGPKAGVLGVSNPPAAQTDGHLARHGGTSLVFAGQTAYLLEQPWLRTMNRALEEHGWRVTTDCQRAMIMGGDTLFLGGDDKVAAYSSATGALLWQQPVQGQAYGLAIARGALYVATHEGTLHCFKAVADSGLQTDRQPAGQDQIESSAEQRQPEAPDYPPVPADLEEGPYLEFVGPRDALVRWKTRRPSPTRLEYGVESWQVVERAPPSTTHQARLTGLQSRALYRYRIGFDFGEGWQSTPEFECDTLFNYRLPSDTDAKIAAEPSTEAEHWAAAIVDRSGVERGLCWVVVGSTAGLPQALARQTSLRVVATESDGRIVAEQRARLVAAGYYGAKISLCTLPTMKRLPFPDHCFNLLVVADLTAAGIGFRSGEPAWECGEFCRVLRPAGGVAYLRVGDAATVNQRQLADDFHRRVAGSDVRATVEEFENAVWLRLERAPLAGAGDWSHQYGLANNATFGGESLAGAQAAGDFEVQWVGRPGPRYQSDRENRKPSPLSTAGRLFLQGLQRIIALDAYNGVILWSLEIPGLRRFNVHHDSANWCADNHSVFAAVRDRCWQIDAVTGAVRRFHRLPTNEQSVPLQAWGYVARQGELLYGTAVTPAAAYREFWGGQFWYDQTDGELTHHVCSDQLFANHAESGRPAWQYRRGRILNPTIAIGGGGVYFVETRDPQALEFPSGRLPHALAFRQQFLVALDSQTGRERWARSIDTLEGRSLFHLAHSETDLVLVASHAGQYEITVFAALTGEQRWRSRETWAGDNKGNHLCRPAIVGGTLYVRPYIFDLASGVKQERAMPGGACGTYAAARNAFFFRAGNLAVWSPQTNRLTSWDRVRPDCWLSSIPAAGLLLAPEGGGGCSCGSWLETSLVFRPRRPEELRSIDGRFP